MLKASLISNFISDFSIIVALIARFFATGAYYLCLQYASELFPTSIRGAGLSACEVFGGVGLLISPWIVYLVSEWVFSLIVKLISIDNTYIIPSKQNH